MKTKVWIEETEVVRDSRQELGHQDAIAVGQG